MINTYIPNVYAGIKEASYAIHNELAYAKELASAKNFVCTPDLQFWTFGKSVGNDGFYDTHGGAAKQKLLRAGFVDIIKSKSITPELRAKIIDAFQDWAGAVTQFNVLKKFENDYNTSKRFEILVHQDALKLLG